MLVSGKKKKRKPDPLPYFLFSVLLPTLFLMTIIFNLSLISDHLMKAISPDVGGSTGKILPVIYFFTWELDFL